MTRHSKILLASDIFQDGEGQQHSSTVAARDYEIRSVSCQYIIICSHSIVYYVPIDGESLYIYIYLYCILYIYTYYQYFIIDILLWYIIIIPLMVVSIDGTHINGFI